MSVQQVLEHLTREVSREIQANGILVVNGVVYINNDLLTSGDSTSQRFFSAVSKISGQTTEQVINRGQLCVYRTDSPTVDDDYIKFQICFGGTSTDFEVHKSRVIFITP